MRAMFLTAARFRLAVGRLEPAATVISFACLGGALAAIYLSRLQEGLFEDGYFVKRFAYNFLHHGSFSWNPTDGPVYGMTSQTLQLIGTLLELVTPEHVFVTLKGVLFGALLLTAFVLYRILAAKGALFGAALSQPTPSSEGTVGLIGCVAGLAMAPIVQLPLIGLETPIALCVVALSLWVVLKPITGGRSLVLITASVILMYLTRPDAAMIPCVVLVGRAFYCWRDRAQPSARRELSQLIGALLCIALVMAVVLAGFRAYYGTALPLPFYVKVHGLSTQPTEYIAHFSDEKSDNALQALLIALPYAFMALHERSRLVLLLLATGVVFGLYHYFATIETMGYMSRFYLPGLVPIFLAGAVAYRSYQQRRRWILSVAFSAILLGAFWWLKTVDKMPPALDFYVPAWIATALMLLGPAGVNPLNSIVAAACLLVGAYLAYPIGELHFDDDDTIVLRQARRRAGFAGIERLRALAPKTVYHTDMGAPGVLFLEARVVDLDGLLNEDITLRGARFEDLCQADRPDAVYVPYEGYQRLRQEVLSSACLSGYPAVAGGKSVQLRLREDVAARYRVRK